MPADVSKLLRRKLQGYSGGRPDVMRLVEQPPRRVLDVGCGAGLLGSQLRQRFPDCELIGVEPDAKRSALAQAHFDKVIAGSVEVPDVLALLQAAGPFDLIVCADVLEHLVQPQQILQQLTRLLAVEGRLITSLPNVRHLSTLVDLYLLGRWPQRDRGIHDRTHLHFFARPNILDLGQRAGLTLCRETRNLRIFEAHPWSMLPARLLDFWPLRGLYTFQYLHLWRHRD